ncbi:uncharacterized protein [Medicago truncatula]|uniref:uncharacterized protein isoform X1 n=1 Tax=Medicago truncatula TaxID=3880 RepID=UPI000D2F3CB4|nr:uncharacterized protein LOC11405582 isoform X1 [Medicago truncatula]
MAVWSLRPKTCPCPSSPSPLQSSSGFTTTNFGHVSFSTIAYPTLSVKYYVNVQINIVDDDEPEDELINRFRKEVIMAGVFQECRRRRFFETPQDKIKRKAREASKRNRKRPSLSEAAALTTLRRNSLAHNFHFTPITQIKERKTLLTYSFKDGC